MDIGKEPLSITDAESVNEAILEMVMVFGEYPETFEPSHENIKWNSINEDSSIGLFPMSGGIYVKKYIDGSYVAQFPFRIVYKSSPTTNPGTLNSQETLEKLAKWMETCSVSFSDEHIRFESISRTSPVYGSGQTITDQEYTVTMQLRYFCRK